ncbi:MAG: XRE family transcriptional regulator [Brevundimonas sp.]|nr:MAG: XRE family transcriptional regulator [Brevundimonas sp.]
MSANSFAEKFGLALNALSMSRGRLAAELGVDKSIVGRWASGAVKPSAYNLERLTHFLAERRPGFTLLDWEADLEAFARVFGVQAPAAKSPDYAGLNLPRQTLEAARTATDLSGDAYEGFWRATHPAGVAPGKFVHMHGMIRRGDDGLLLFDLGSSYVRYVGPVLPIEGHLFVFATDTGRWLPELMIFNVIPGQTVKLMDGLLLTAGNALRIPTTYAIVMERVGDLSGDREADDARAAELWAGQQFVEAHEVPEALRGHLLRDIGPDAASKGGDLLLTANSRPSLAQFIASTMGSG